MQEYKLCANWNWDAFVMNYLIFQHKCAIFANVLHHIKDYQMAHFKPKFMWCPKATLHKLLDLSIECRILAFSLLFSKYFYMMWS
jgi:hypothetical protein